MEEVWKRVEERTLAQPAADIGAFVEKILQRYGNKVMGIFMYGSVLSSVTKSATSFPDFCADSRFSLTLPIFSRR